MGPFDLTYAGPARQDMRDAVALIELARAGLLPHDDAIACARGAQALRMHAAELFRLSLGMRRDVPGWWWAPPRYLDVRWAPEDLL